MSSFTHVFLDVYGTIFHEDDHIVAQICQSLAECAPDRLGASDIADEWWKSFVRLCSAAAGDSFQTQRDLVRHSLRETTERLQVEYEIDPLVERQYEHWRRPPIFDETRDFIQRVEAGGIEICLVSNIDDDELQAALEYHQLTFPHIVTSESARAYKPNASIFEDALKVTGASRESVLHIGDSFSNDVRGAAAIGLPVVWLNRKGRAIPERGLASYVFQDLSEALPILVGDDTSSQQ